MKRPAESKEMDEVRAAREEVVAEIAATTAAIEKVEQQIEVVETRIEIIQSKMEVAVETEVFPKGYFTIEEYIHDLRDEKSQLRAKEDDLRDEKSQLRVEKGKLLDKEAGLKAEEIVIKKQGTESGSHPVFQLKPFDEYRQPFEAKLPSKYWRLNFVERPELEKARQLVQDAIRKFMDPDAKLADQFLHFPVVDGASGSGKSRLCWEVCKSLFDEGVAHSVYVDCSKDSHLYGSEKDQGGVDMMLARLIVVQLSRQPFYSHSRVSLNV